VVLCELPPCVVVLCVVGALCVVTCAGAGAGACPRPCWSATATVVHNVAATVNAPIFASRILATSGWWEGQGTYQPVGIEQIAGILGVSAIAAFGFHFCPADHRLVCQYGAARCAIRHAARLTSA